MVRTRITPLAKVMRDSASEFITDTFGSTFTRERRTEVRDGQGNITGISTAEVTVSGDLQFVTQKDRKLLESGELKEGDALFMCLHDADVEEYDIIVHGSDRWDVDKEINTPEIGGFKVHREFRLVAVVDDE